MNQPRHCAALALLALLAAPPALAQRGGCGLGAGLDALREAERGLAVPPASLTAGREEAAAMAARLHGAAASLAGCGCRQAALHAAEAAGLAEQAGSEASLERLRRSLDRARFSAGLARGRLDRQGCS
jgi:hypothetical protein